MMNLRDILLHLSYNSLQVPLTLDKMRGEMATSNMNSRIRIVCINNSSNSIGETSHIVYRYVVM